MRLQPPKDAEAYVDRPLTENECDRFILSHRIKYNDGNKWIDESVLEYLGKSDVLESQELTEKFLTMFPAELEWYAQSAIDRIVPIILRERLKSK